MQRFIAIVIGVLFLAYGLIRIGVGSAMLGQEFGIFEIDALEEPIIEVGKFLHEKADKDKQLIPVTIAATLAILR